MEVYTDGGCLGNPGPGGFGVVFIKNGQILHEHAAGYIHTTNNRMEYRACIYALEKIKEKKFKSVTLYTDSKYVLDSVNNWGHKWKKLGWKRNASGSKTIENLDLFKKCYTLNEALDVKWQWVKGHAGNKGNERADDLANGSAAWPKERLIEDSEELFETKESQTSLF